MVSSTSDEILDNAEDEGGKTFSGLAYELKKDGSLKYYCFYQEGMAHGPEVEFYSEDKIKCEKHFKYGQLFGESIYRYIDRSMKSKIFYEHSIIVEHEEWDEAGNKILHKKLQEDDSHYLILKSRREL
jgi:antitoxin component YwqK of YwqJK toxin-antitoxin module